MIEPLAVGITTLDELAAALKARRQSLGLSQWLVDDIAGMVKCHTHKIETGKKGLGKITVPLLLGALKCEIALMPSVAKHGESVGATSRYVHSSKKDHHAEIGAKGGRARARNLSAAKRRAISRAGARARWAKVEDTK